MGIKNSTPPSALFYKINYTWSKGFYSTEYDLKEVGLFGLDKLIFCPGPGQVALS